MTSAAASPVASPDWPRLVLGGLVGGVIGLALLGVVLAAWWLGVGRHQLQPLARVLDGFEARLAEAAGPPSQPDLRPVYVFDPSGASATGRWLRDEAPRLAAAGREARLLEVDSPEAQALGAEIDRLARRWSEPPRRPLILWRDASGLMLCRCDSPRAVALARRALAAETAPDAPARAASGPSGLPYPTLGPPPAPLDGAPDPIAPINAEEVEVDTGPAPRLPGDPVPASASPATPAARPTPRPNTPRRTDPPEARRDADSLFF